MFGDGLSPKLRKILFDRVGPCFGFDVPKLLGNNIVEMPQQKSLSFVSRLKNSFCCGKSASLDIKHDDESPLSRSRTKARINGKCRSALLHEDEDRKDDLGLLDEVGTDPNNLMPRKLYNRKECRVADDVAVISASVKDRKDQIQKVTESKLAAAILDRVFFYFFIVTYFTSSFLILLLPALRP
jgi:hypothetical protein